MEILRVLPHIDLDIDPRNLQAIAAVRGQLVVLAGLPLVAGVEMPEYNASGYSWAWLTRSSEYDHLTRGEVPCTVNGAPSTFGITARLVAAHPDEEIYELSYLIRSYDNADTWFSDVTGLDPKQFSPFEGLAYRVTKLHDGWLQEGEVLIVRDEP